MDDYLITPIQRCPRYLLLSGSISKKIPSKHPDFKNMNAAVDKLKQVCDFVNDSITSDKKMKEFYFETSKKMKQIKDLLIPSRKFIHMVDSKERKRRVRECVVRFNFVCTNIF